MSNQVVPETTITLKHVLSVVLVIAAVIIGCFLLGTIASAQANAQANAQTKPTKTTKAQTSPIPVSQEDQEEGQRLFNANKPFQEELNKAFSAMAQLPDNTEDSKVASAWLRWKLASVKAEETTKALNAWFAKLETKYNCKGCDYDGKQFIPRVAPVEAKDN